MYKEANCLSLSTHETTLLKSDLLKKKSKEIASFFSQFNSKKEGGKKEGYPSLSHDAYTKSLPMA